MWYAGHDGISWKAGYATSVDGVNWNKYSGNPILSSNPNDPTDNNVHTPRVINDNGIYKMWYTASPNDTSNFSIKYATSTDGINWMRDTSINFPAQAWDNGLRVYPFVLKVGSEYKMWYSSYTGIWKIGLATSNDGVNWTPYAGNPILYPTKSWEGRDLDGSSLLYNGSEYEIFYHGSSNLSYATSTDGINWIKPADKNPVLTKTAGTFDANYMAGPSALRLPNGTTLLYYGGLSGSTWRIGLAADGPIATPSATPSPTPMPTSKKVVIVPGLGASWNKDAIMNCKANDYIGNWRLAFYAEQYYKPLYTVLSDEGFTVSPYYYDWRKKIPSHANALNKFINTNASSNERINLLGHSMGGLLGRAYLESVTNQNRLAKFLSIGSPHRGVSSSYPAWSGGAIWEKDLLRKIAMTLAIKRCDFYENPRKNIQKFLPSIQNFLRIDDYLRSNATGQLKSVTSMKAQNNWLPTNNFTPPFYGVTVGSLTGVDQQTLDIIKVKKRSSIDAALGNWADGKPTSREYSFNGDDTVLAQSSDIPGSIIKHISQGHTDLIHSNDGYEAILQFLDPDTTFKPVSNTLLQKPTSAMIIIADPATAEVVSPDGVTQSSDEGTIAIYNPKSGNYKLKFNPKSSTTKVIIAQFLENERVLWKEYNLTGSKAMQKSLLFDPLNPQEDVLR